MERETKLGAARIQFHQFESPMLYLVHRISNHSAIYPGTLCNGQHAVRPSSRREGVCVPKLQPATVDDMEIETAGRGGEAQPCQSIRRAKPAGAVPSSRACPGAAPLHDSASGVNHCHAGGQRAEQRHREVGCDTDRDGCLELEHRIVPASAPFDPVRS